MEHIAEHLTLASMFHEGNKKELMNTIINKAKNEEITIEDLKAIRKYEGLSDENAYKILDSVKQLALILYEYSKQGSINELSINKNTNIEHETIYNQAA